MSSVAPQRCEILQVNVFDHSVVCCSIILRCSVSNTNEELSYKVQSSLVFAFFILKEFQNIDVATTGVIFFVVVVIFFFFCYHYSQHFLYSFFPERSLVFAKFNFSLTPYKSFVASQPNNRKKCKPKWNK